MSTDSVSFSGLVPAATTCAVRPVAVADRTSDPRPKVLHITPGIGGGGAEALLVNLAEAMHGGAWRTVVVAVDGRAWPDRAARLREVTSAFHDLESPVLLRGSFLRRLREVIRAEKPDVVQTWMHHADLVGGLSARLAGVRHIVWSIHCREIHRNPGDGELKTRIFRTLLAAAAKIVPQRIISCSAAAIEDHVALGYPRRKLQWIPNGVCPRRFAPCADAGPEFRRNLGIPGNAPIVGYAGRFHEMKQLDVFFRAAALLQQRLPQARFVLCGGTSGDLDAVSRSAWERLPQKEQVHFIPFRPDLERVYPALTLFTLSSRTEACPMTLLEAMACGVPCAATDVGDCAALLGDPAFVAPAGDAAGLASVWQRILTLDAAARANLGRNLRARVVENFSITRTARQYESVYAGLAEHRA